MENREVMLEKKIDTVMEDGEKLAIVLVSDSFRFGGNWAYIKNTDSLYEEKMELLKEEKEHLKVSTLSNGTLLILDKQYLTECVNKVIPGGITESFVKEARSVSESELVSYKKFVEKVLKGESQYVYENQGCYELVVGCYSVNVTNKIKVQGLERPAYKLPLEVMLKVLKEVNKKYGREIALKIMNKEGKVGLLSLDELKSGNMKYVLRGLEIADSMTGVFLTLRLK